MKKLLKGLLRLLAVILALLLCVVRVMLVVPLTETGDKTSVEGSADCMADLPDELLLGEIVMPGTHDSATQKVQLAFFSKCQAKDVAGQLEDGFRYLDIRLGIDAEQGTMKLMHGFTSCKAENGVLTLDRVLDSCYAFLERHPAETVVFAVKQEYGDESIAEFQTLLQKYIDQNRDKWLLTDTVPSLGESRGKLVLMRRYEDAAGFGPSSGIPMLWENQSGSKDLSLHAVPEDNGGYTLWVQDRYEYGTQDKWNAFLAGLDAAGQREKGEVALHFLSTKGTLAYGHPYHFASALNQALMDSDSVLDGWVIVDFASARLAERIYTANFT